MTLLFEAKLYAETLLNIYYLVMSVYGWLIWKKRKEAGAQQVSWTTKKELTIALIIAVLGFILLYIILNKYTDSDVPYMDGFVSSTAWAGMWLLAKRKIENWIFLNISNIVAIPLLIHKHLIMMAALTTFLFIVAVLAFFDWKKIYNNTPKHQPL
jgi:nicotinamide mononucleotide transporter